MRSTGSTTSAWHAWTLRAGGRPRLLNLDDEDFVIQTAATRPTKLGQPFTRWSLRLTAYLRKVHGRIIRIGREALCCLLARRGITFQRPADPPIRAGGRVSGHVAPQRAPSGPGT
jgi:transposase